MTALLPDRGPQRPPYDPATDTDDRFAARRTPEFRALQSAAQHLKPWQRDFARWLVGNGQGGTPKRAIQLEKLKELTGWEWTEADRKELLLEPAFRAYKHAWISHGLPDLQDQVVQGAHQAVKTMRWALRKAREKEDLRAIPPLANPFLDRVLPPPSRNDPSRQQVNQVNIVLSAQQMAGLDPQPIEVTAEPLTLPPADE